MPDELCLLSVHAHPDDESSKGSCTVARYHAEGVHTVLVSCTGGEEGDILNPAMDRPEVREHLAEVRRAELEAAITIIGYDEVVHLGYRDSGMPDTLANADPRSFAMAPLEEAIGRLVAIIRRTRPQVLITYGNDQQHYPHPDHLRVHEISVAAFDAAGDPTAFPGTGEPFSPAKLYYSASYRQHMFARHEKFLELGLESPYAKRIAEGDWHAEPEPEPETKIDIAGFELVRLEALRAHATQIDPSSSHWFGLPEEAERSIRRFDPFILACSRVGAIGPEDDLFAGVRELARGARESPAGSGSSRRDETMAKWLTQEWLDISTELAVDQPLRPGASARLQYVIAGGPEGVVEYYWVVKDGKLVENRLGTLADAEVTLTEEYEDALAMQKGELDANTAFMQGKIKVTGDVAKLMALLPITMSPEFHEFQTAVLAITDF